MKLHSYFLKKISVILYSAFCCQIISAQNWTYVGGITAQDIAVGKNGAVWATGKNSAIYRWTGSSWQTMSGGAERIAVDPEGAAWVIGSKYIFKYNLATNNWEQKPGTATDIGVGADGTVWVIGANTVPGGYDIYKWNGSDWTKIPGGALRIAVDPSGNAWVVNSSNTVFRYNGSAFEVKPGAVKDIGIGANGTIWCSGTDERIYQWNGSNWGLKSGGASWISVTPDGNAWAVNAAGDVYRTTDAASGIPSLYPRGQTNEYKILQALRFTYYANQQTYSSLEPLYQALGRLGLLAAEMYSLRQPTMTAENLLSTIAATDTVRKKISGILAWLVLIEASKNSNDAQTVALKTWTTNLYRSFRIRCAKGVLDEYQKWKANPCMYDGEGYKKPSDCNLGHISIANLFTSYSPPEDILGKAALKSVFSNNADTYASGVAVALSGVIAAGSTIALASSLGIIAGSSLVNTLGTPIVLAHTCLVTAFGGSGGVAGSAAGALGVGWAGVVAAPIAAAVLAIVVGTMEGFKVVEAAKVEPMLKMKLGAAMSEYININNVAADSSSAQMFFLAFQEAAHNGYVITQPKVDGEVRFYNQGGYVAQYRLSYTLNGQPQEFTTPSLSVGFEKTYAIPYNATNIKTQAWALVGAGSWKEILNQTLDRPTYICYTSYGTVFAPTYKTDCPEVGNMTATKNELTITQGGGYSAWIRLTYVDNGQTVTKIDQEKPLGFREVYAIPAAATNIKLVIWSATGWVGDPWKEFVNKTWPTPPTECIKVMGTASAPTSNNECK